MAIRARALRKRYDGVTAVDGLDLDVAEGEFFGLLGPNGAGKTTTIHILATLTRPDDGELRVADCDVREEPVRVRSRIGLVFQESALDGTLSAWENLCFTGALHGLSQPDVEERAGELLNLFDLGAKKNARVATLSGGMRRALDIARGLLHRPQVLFLDEPTLGLDVINRRAIWRFLERLRQQRGMTMLLTTHYLEEARNCDRVVFLDRGKPIERGQPAELIARMGEYILEIEPVCSEYRARALAAELGQPIQENERLLFRVPPGKADVASLQERMRGEASSIRLRKPDLNDVYVWTHHKNVDRA